MSSMSCRQAEAKLLPAVSSSVCNLLPVIFLAANLISLALPVLTSAQSAASTAWYVTIVLPPKVVAGYPATLAVFGADGRLAPNVTVVVGDGQSVKTDATGRAFFTVPATPGVMFADASGVSATALVDNDASERAHRDKNELTVAPVISLKDRFSICGGGFRGDADANRVTMNGDRALVVAASPECLVVLPSPRAMPGAAKLAVDSSGTRQSAITTLISLQFEAPQPPPVPGQKSQLTVHVEGSDAPLAITIQNETPGVLEFLKGDTQELRTSGGSRNIAQVEVGAIRSGDFSFDAKLLPLPDISGAQQYLRAAVPLAPKPLQRRVKALSDRLASHPRDREKVRQELAKVISTTIAGNFRTLLEAARLAI
ncbi:MAG: hypothetical protein WB987_00915 [Candidatus Acidiferrales bacterium]